MKPNTSHPPDLPSVNFIIALPARPLADAINALTKLCVALDEHGLTATSKQVFSVLRLLETDPTNTTRIKRAWNGFRLPPMADFASVDYEFADRTINKLASL
ncbi:hypothetical protein EON82_17085 [bacterium]|nr:MAG: hypothetical protein EON82_17085 [bacterium]